MAHANPPRTPFAAPLRTCLASLAFLTITLGTTHQPSDEPRIPLVPARKPAPAGPSGLARSEFTVAIEGTKQGRFKGEGTGEAAKGKIVATNFEYEVRVPRDAATGAPTGKRQHQPVVFTKEWGAASPQLFQAATTGEVLKTVVFEFYPSGAGEVFYTSKLTNATVIGVRQKMVDGRFVEEVSLAFGRIDVEHRPSKTAAGDEGK